MLMRMTFLIVLMVLFAPIALGDIYKKTDQNGRVYFTDEPKGKGYRIVMRTPKKGTVDYKNFVKNRRKFTPLIHDKARLFEVDPALVMAVIHAESAYDQYAKSRAGAVGLMQLMPATAERFGVSNRRNATQNVSGGIQYLRHLLELFEFNIRLTLAAYNAGESAVAKYDNNIPPYPETQNYVKKVVGYYQNYLSGNKDF